MALTRELARPGMDGRPDQRARRLRRRHGVGFWIVGYAFLVTMAFSTVPAPLYVLYQARDHFGSFMVTVIFAAYAVGVVASLFLAGHISDWHGRRRILAIAMAVNMLSGVVFLAWPSVPGLIVGRVVSGISIGMLTATATAYLSELDARPGRASPGPGPRSRRPRPTSAASGSARCWPDSWPSTRGRRCRCRTWCPRP